MEFSPQEVKTIMESYSRELVATILGLLELSGNNENLLNTIKQAIYDKRDITLMKHNVQTKGTQNDYQENYPKTYRRN